MYYRIPCSRVNRRLQISRWRISTHYLLSYYTICVWRLSKGKLYLVVPVVRFPPKMCGKKGYLILLFCLLQAAMVLTEFGLSLAYSTIAYVSVYDTFSQCAALTLVNSSLTRLETFSDLVQIKVRPVIKHKASHSLDNTLRRYSQHA